MGMAAILFNDSKSFMLILKVSTTSIDGPMWNLVKKWSSDLREEDV